MAPLDTLPHYDAPTATATARRPYYVALGRATDSLLRCKDCRRLVPLAIISTLGACPGCGTRTFAEIRGLSLWEYFKVRVGWIDFPYRKEFLKEFGHAD
jgi:hypothetical protein